MAPFPQPFYARPAREVARALLGQRLVSHVDGRRTAGIIVETEAYCDADEPDLACHGAANRGRPTARTAVMFGPPGHAYVYFTYGMHWLFNVVTGAPGQANAVLVRALAPDDGLETIAERRSPRRRRDWTNGPAKLAQALAITGAHNGEHLFRPNGVILIEPGLTVAADAVATGPRVGLGNIPEPWYSIPWRYWIAGHPDVSPAR